MSTQEPSATVRLDRWLLAARLYKTRSVAQEHCDGGHVKVNGAGAASSKAVRVGDTVAAVTPGGERIYRVLGLAQRRASAAEARGLFEDLTPPPPPRQEPVAERDRGAGRPTKREARLLRQLRGW
jgi:ribosome-associated heat shock protein Hsp15